MLHRRLLTIGLLAIVASTLASNPARAGLELYTEPVSPPGGATGAGFLRPVIENFNGLTSNITLAGGPPGFSGGTVLAGGLVRIHAISGGILFPNFAGEVGNQGLTIFTAQPILGRTSFIANGAPFESLGFRISDAGALGGVNGLRIRVYQNVSDPDSAFLREFGPSDIGLGFISTTEVAFIGVRNDGVGATQFFSRLDLVIAPGSTLLLDSTQIDDLRGSLDIPPPPPPIIPEPSTWLLCVLGAGGLWYGRRRLLKLAPPAA